MSDDSSQKEITDSDCSIDELGKDALDDPSTQIKTAIEVKLWDKLFESYTDVKFNKQRELKK